MTQLFTTLLSNPPAPGQCHGVVTADVDGHGVEWAPAMRCLWPAVPGGWYCGHGTAICEPPVDAPIPHGPPLPTCACGQPGATMIERVGRARPLIYTAHCGNCAEAYFAWLYDEEE